MMLRRRQARRAGTTLVECAAVYPVLFLVVVGIMMLGISVFRYQQVAHMAREGARYAAVHGAKYAEENAPNPAATPADVYTYAIRPHAAGMDPANIAYAVSWNQDNKQTSSAVVTVNGQSVIRTRANIVSVTVTYSWNTGLFGVVPVSSTAVMTMCY